MDKYKKYREKLKLKKIVHEQNNGLELGYPGIRISDFIKEKILSGKTQILVIDKKVIQFHKDCVTGYWVNNTYRLRLHREKLRLELGLTKEQMEGLDVHHIDGDKDKLFNIPSDVIRNMEEISDKHITLAANAEKEFGEDWHKVAYIDENDIKPDDKEIE